MKLMSSPDKLTGEKVTNAVDTDDFGGSSARVVWWTDIGCAMGLKSTGLSEG